MSKKNKVVQKRIRSVVSVKSLADKYGVTEKTMSRWLDAKTLKEKIGEYKAKAFTPRQVSIIVDHLGLP